MADDTLEKIAKVEAHRSPYRDGKVLATALKLAYFAGMNRGEILSLQIKDILDTKGAIVTEIKSCAKIVDGKTLKLILTDDVRAILAEYLLYLKKNGYPVNRSALLFPQKTRTATKPYDEGKINEDLNDIDSSVSFKSVRRAGLEQVFSQYQDDPTDKELRYRRTAQFTRTGIRNIKKMRGEYRRAGTRYAAEDEDGDDYFSPILPNSDPDDDWG